MEERRALSAAELIILLLALAVLLLFVIPGTVSIFNQIRSGVDKENIHLLNYFTNIYSITRNVSLDEVFSGLNSDEARMQALVDAGLLTAIPEPRQEGAVFSWSWDSDEWVLYLKGEAAPFTELGSTIDEISSAMVRLELKLKASTGTFGRSWGDYAYTDIGLNPNDWKSAIGHIIYTPCGSYISASPEKGYTFLVEDRSGSVLVLPASYNWSLVCDCESGVWYYHTVLSGNEIDISTLQIIPS